MILLLVGSIIVVSGILYKVWFFQETITDEDGAMKESKSIEERALGEATDDFVRLDQNDENVSYGEALNFLLQSHDRKN